MSVKRVHAVKNRRRLFVKLALVLAVLAASAFLLKQKKDMVVREGTQFLQRFLSRETQLDIKVDKISGRLSGVVRFDNVRLEDPSQSEGMRLILHAKRVEVRYRLSDLFLKKLSSKVTLLIVEPEIAWYSRLGPERAGFSAWLKQWGMAQRSYVNIVVKDLKITQPPEGETLFEGIQINYADDAFRLRVPVRHLPAWGHDISTEFVVKGLIKPAEDGALLSVSGEISTEGTVVNWSPLPWESRFTYTLSPELLKVESSELLGGFRMSGSVDFGKNDEMQLSLEAKQYPLANLAPFLRHTERRTPEGLLDLDANVNGEFTAPHLEAYATITGGRSGPNHYQSLNLYVKGIYPSLRLSDSRVLFEDGKTMRFADQNVEFEDLFDETLYSKWISGSDQDTVVLGNWELRRPDEQDENQEFTLQRSFGKHASLQVKKANAADEAKLDSPEKDDMQVGFEYRLKSKDTLKFETRGEDDRFVGVEHKMSF